MTAVVSRERARATCLTGAAGMLMLAVAVMMMVVAAPARGYVRPHPPAKPPAVQLTTDVGGQLPSRSDSARMRARLAGPDVREVAGRPPRTFLQWAQAHAGAF